MFQYKNTRTMLQQKAIKYFKKKKMIVTVRLIVPLYKNVQMLHIYINLT